MPGGASTTAARRRPGPESVLNRAVIVEAALEFDLEELTMVALARRLGVAHSALYNYFPSKARLVAALVEVRSQAVAVPARNGRRWQEWLADVYGVLRGLLAKTLAAEGYPISTASNLVLWNSIAETLLAAGFSASETWDVMLRIEGTCLAAVTLARRAEHYGPLTREHMRDFVPLSSPARALIEPVGSFDLDAWFRRQASFDIAGFERLLTSRQTKE
jgi:AcrR family transcriptional regulator